MRKFCYISTALSVFFGLTSIPVQAAPSREEKSIAAAAQASLAEFVEFLKIPNVMHKSTADMRRNADWAEAAFRKYGFDTRQLEDGETPMVFAEWPGGTKARKTVLFYAHMDGQAVFPAEWDQTDPFTPALKRKGPDGTWKTLPIEELISGKILDPEWRLFARSAADDKAPILMLMAAMAAVRASGKLPAINIKIILDSHEEGGPPTLKDVVARNAELLRADAIVMLDGPMHASNKPTIVFGHRGGGNFSLTVFGARTELHSGHYGNYAPNPVFGLATLLASFKDQSGRVRIPGFYDGVDMSPANKAILAAVPDDQTETRLRLGIAESEKVGDNYQEAMNYPTLNVTAVKAGEPDSRRSIIPAFATASFDARTAPGISLDRQITLVRKWVQNQGYHLVDGEPTEEERRTYPRLAAIAGGRGGDALMTPLNAAVGLWAHQAFRNEFKEEPVRIPIMGGGIPTKPLADGVKAPIVLIPLVNNDNNQHAANENLRLGNYFMGVRALYSLFTQPL